jgi:hypothetical protein
MNDRETARKLLPSDCFDRFLVFFSVRPDMYQNSVSDSAKTAFTYPFQFSIRESSLHLAVYNSVIESFI